MKFLPLIIFLIFALPGLIVLVLILKLFLKGKAAFWEGVVVDKGYTEKDKGEKKGVIYRIGSENKEHFFYIKVKLDNGEIHSIAVTPKMYEEIKVGDRIRKEKGALWPKKIG